MEKKTIKKSELAMYKGFGWLNKQIADKLGVSEKEIITGLQKFGMMKTRGGDKLYEIEYIDDSSQYQPKTASESLSEVI